MPNPLQELAEELAAEAEPKNAEVEAYLESEEAAPLLAEIEGVLTNLNLLKAIGVTGSTEGNSIESIGARVILRKVRAANASA